MANYKLTIEYNGNNFSGSQIQNHQESSSHEDLRTVQGELEKVLNYLCGSEGKILQNHAKPKTIFSSRTDAGVHALDQVLNFHLDFELNNLDKFLLSLNSQLPNDISATKINLVNDEFHARHSALSREYMYKIFNRNHRPVLRLDSLAWIKENLDFNILKKHSQYFLGEHDFSSYAKLQNGQSPLCTIYKSEWIQESKYCFKYYIKANRFLRHMVRRLVGEMLYAAKGNDIQPFTSAIDYSAEAQALTLISVNYSE